MDERTDRQNYDSENRPRICSRVKTYRNFSKLKIPWRVLCLIRTDQPTQVPHASVYSITGFILNTRSTLKLLTLLNTLHHSQHRPYLHSLPRVFSHCCSFPQVLQYQSAHNSVCTHTHNIRCSCSFSVASRSYLTGISYSCSDYFRRHFKSQNSLLPASLFVPYSRLHSSLLLLAPQIRHC